MKPKDRCEEKLDGEAEEACRLRERTTPEGKPDAYTGAGIPRPIYEDMDELKRKRKKLGKLKRSEERNTDVF